MKKLIITGATGMIGSTLAKIAAERNYKVCCIVRKDSKRINNIPSSKNITIIQCNLDNYCLLNLHNKYDTFIHLAWDKTIGNYRDDVDIQMKNIKYTMDAVNLAVRSGCTHFIGAGSQAEYGIVKKPLTSAMAVNPESGYGIAKFSAGKLSKLLCSQLGIKFNWLRILSIYGEKDSSHTLVSYVIEKLKKSESPKLTKCEQIWDYLYCDDVATAFLSVCEKGIDGKIYPLGSGEKRLLKEYIEDIRKVINPKIPINYGEKEYYKHQPMFLSADISDLTEDTGWTSQVTFKEGIKKIANI